jgi:hypothetical protein
MGRNARRISVFANPAGCLMTLWAAAALCRVMRRKTPPLEEFHW